MNRNVREISQRLSLRPPQEKALEVLSQLVTLLPMSKEADLDFCLNKVRSEFPQIKEFSRKFPNLCFALATGVGKTRLMGAMIAYLVTVKGIRNFFILAPNSTILDKLVTEFSDPHHPKYVFQGLGDVMQESIRIITADNYQDGVGLKARQGDLFAQGEIHINIFNVAMIHADNRRMKMPQETLDGCMSYFEYLAELPDLVVFMDEAHRYRAERAMQALEDLQPILGVELTATARVEQKGAKSLAFENIAYEYPLSHALRDGYVKEPYVVGRDHFKAELYDPESLERLKLEDAIRVHEDTKVHLEMHCRNRRLPLVKPFMLVVTQDTEHANRLMEQMESSAFFEGRYRGKIQIVHSKVKEDEKMVRALLSIEEPRNPVEIVIHVDMLREGWDVKNLYTIVPLRKANSKTLIEQSLGRGLRLPFGNRTGVQEVDRLSIVSHDRFDELIDEANKSSSIIKAGLIIGKEIPLQPQDVIEVQPRIMQEFEALPESKRALAEAMLKLDSEDAEHLQKTLQTHRPDLDCSIDTIRQIQRMRHALEIQVPRLRTEPRLIRPGRYRLFQLDLQSVYPQPLGHSIVSQSLEDRNQKIVQKTEFDSLSRSPEDTLANLIFEYTDVAENTDENLSLVMSLVTQVMKHLRSYLKEEKSVQNVVFHHGLLLAKFVHAQMQNHYEEPEYQYETSGKDDYAFCKKIGYSIPSGTTPRPIENPFDDLQNIRSYCFKGFSKSNYPVVKFDSNPERLLALLLERAASVLKWCKLPRGSFSHIFYHEDHAYEPDFVVETRTTKYLCEVKRSGDLDNPVVLQKQQAAIEWCKEATAHARRSQGKPWEYLLIPHDVVSLSKEFDTLAKTYTKSPTFSREEILFTLQSKGITARALYSPKGFQVLKGSTAALHETPSLQRRIRQKRYDLVRAKALTYSTNTLVFAETVTFASPSTAASVILGTSANGQKMWKDAAGGSPKDIEEAP